MAKGCTLRSIRPIAIIAVFLLAGCSSEPRRSQPAARQAPEPRITQLYASPAEIRSGEKSLLCYGVENAASVGLQPPEHTLTPSPTRCVEVLPSKTTTYTVTAADARGRSASQSVTITVGPPRAPRAHIVEVHVSALKIKPRDLVQICFKAQHARSVRIDPVGPYPKSTSEGCISQQPVATTTYTVIVTGAEGDTDREKVTIQVAP